MSDESESPFDPRLLLAVRFDLPRTRSLLNQRRTKPDNWAPRSFLPKAGEAGTADECTRIPSELWLSRCRSFRVVEQVVLKDGQSREFIAATPPTKSTMK